MPFEPRILRLDEQPDEGSEVRADSVLAQVTVVPSEAKPESWLPVELEVLAEQLSEDSAHLLQQYPASEHPAPRMAELAARMEEAAANARDRRTSYRVLQRYATLAAGLMITVGAGLWLTRDQGDARHASLNVDAGVRSAVTLAEKSDAIKPVVQVSADVPVDAKSLVAASEGETDSSATSAGAPVLEPQDFMDLDSVTQSAVADLVEDGQLRQGTISL